MQTQQRSIMSIILAILTQLCLEKNIDLELLISFHFIWSW